MFYREFRRPKRAKFKIYLSFEGCRGFRCGSLFVAVVVSTGCRWSGSLGVVLPFVACSLISSAFLLCSRCVALEICLFSRFKGVFSAVWGVCVGLCCSCVLRGLWGFCVRERLGGFVACGVFCLSFLLLSSCLVCPCVFVVFIVSFSLSVTPHPWQNLK